MQERLEALEKTLQRLRNATDLERSKLLEEHFNSDITSHENTNVSGHNALPVVERNTEVCTSADDDLANLLDETTVTKNGQIDFFGPTSHYHVQREKGVRIPSRLSVSRETDILYSSLTIRGMPNAACAPATRPRDDLRSALSPEIPEPLVDELLDVYWCWPHHFHLVLCRKIFMRDLSISGPFVTVFLLNCTLSQAARFSDRPNAPESSTFFAKKALECLPEELERGSSIPTLQGLLILSARECTYGRTSQGWIYSGMAFRMMRDLGIHIHPHLLNHRLGGQLTADVLALRQQIFWSCYTWDKAISMCLGRPPMIHERQEVPTPDAWPDGEEMDNDPWCPLLPTPLPPNISLAQKSNTATRFSAYCHLSVMMNEILDTLYARVHTDQELLDGYFEHTIKKLTSWAESLPTDIYLQESTRITSCPPLHILLFNMVYQATIALLCRPFRALDINAKDAATKAAQMIDHLATLHIRRFGFRVLTYLETYTIFVGATVNLLDLKEGNEAEAEAAKARLAFNIAILRSSRSTMSTIQSAEVIEQALAADNSCKPTMITSCTEQFHQDPPSSHLIQETNPEVQPAGMDEAYRSMFVSQDQQFRPMSNQKDLEEFNVFYNLDLEEVSLERMLGSNTLGDIQNFLAEVDSSVIAGNCDLNHDG
ncbi:fungal specific transcription factor domain-containing protein [Trichoderma breve]|uniref:Fungal specific transcription factor domain-containing protein n=1 Tax=Trichoderma breve TaxID=2034170 RepID=A0A9W9E825_9HYPO|nr:fungal specific transcription factor domain-containing protein [Trichoderma breve]KAJ4858036.1 fungal specific transcription factor domain-containing protein [Trichoderma breve]